MPQTHTTRTVLLAATLPLLAAAAVGSHAVNTRKPIVADNGQESRPAQPEDPAGFNRVQRPGSVDLRAEYDLEGLLVPEEEIHTLLPRDAIPALTDPKLEANAEASWLPPEARIIEVEVNGEALGVPLRVLDWHEVINTTLGGEPIAVTYCPLCDSAAVFSRRVKTDGGEEVLEFGVSGALYNSNVLMYDREHRGLWSQLGMEAVSGPMAGAKLRALPVRVVPFSDFRASHPGAPVVSRETGHERDYTGSPYDWYFQSDRLLVPLAGMGDALDRKTLGLGIATGEGDNARSWFVPEDAIGDDFRLVTPEGEVRARMGDAGVVVTHAPEGVRTAQTFYYAWSAFYPSSRVVRADAQTEEADILSPPGLGVGDPLPDVTLIGADGGPLALRSLLVDAPLVVTFYRGGWCPICTRDLSAWGGRMDELKAAGGTMVAITPERLDLALETRTETGADYRVLVDPEHKASRAFRVHFTVDDETRAKYEEYGLLVNQANADGSWDLPAPATFVVDAEGAVRWVFADWDYRRRADPDDVINAVRSLTDRP